MSVTLGEWYEYWLDTYMKDTIKQSTYASYRSYLNKHFCVLGKILPVQCDFCRIQKG